MVGRVSAVRDAASVGMLVMLIAVGCGGRLTGVPASSTPIVAAPPSTRVASNITRADYAGSEACATCHAELAERFAGSPMHRMTRALPTDIRAPFDAPNEAARSFRFRDETVRMQSLGGTRFFVIDTPGRPQAIYRLVRVIGGHYREDYVGRRVDAVRAEPRDLPDGREMIMPVTWHFRHGEWRYKGYSVQINERAALATGPEWDKTCIFCHNTEPYLSTILDEAGGYEKLTYQGSVPSNLLPDDRRLTWRVKDMSALAAVLRAEIGFLGGAVPRDDMAAKNLPGHALVATRERFGAEHLVEIGIGCESCHNGARAHVDAPEVLPDFRVQSPLIGVTRGDGADLTDAEAQNHVCARCHSVLLSTFEHTWEGGRRDGERDSIGGSSINSGEGRDFLLGGCARQMTCTACHDPHAADPRARLDALATPAGNSVCTPCHAALADDDGLRAHAHHDPAGAGGSCVGCHMPKKNVGLNYDLERYHRIGSPTDAVRVEHDRPLECALCHRDATVKTLVETMERWWGKRYDRARLAALYGEDLDVPALLTTLARGESHERAAAIGTLGDGDGPLSKTVAQRLVDAFGDSLPINRYLAREALRKRVGVLAPVDMALPGEALRDAARVWFEGLTKAGDAATERPGEEPGH